MTPIIRIIVSFIDGNDKAIDLFIDKQRASYNSSDAYARRHLFAFGFNIVVYL